ncbi:hypothetical protein OROHE_006092 [Orobanche hederae]
MLRLKARLNFCGKEITEDDMIQKTRSTFPTSALILANQYRLEYNNKRITTFSKLINLLQVDERHNEVLVNNNARQRKFLRLILAKRNVEGNPTNRVLDALILNHMERSRMVVKDVAVVDVVEVVEALPAEKGKIMLPDC